MRQAECESFGVHHFSARIKKKMKQLAASKTSVIEAPPGYGKTTVAKDFLSLSEEDEQVYWFTAVDEAPTALYRRLCREIEKIDYDAGKYLCDIDIPNAFTLGDVCNIVRAIGCERKTWLVIDNFQHFLEILPAPFLTALIERSGEMLHVIIITQTFNREFVHSIVGRGVLHITAFDLMWEADDIRRYFEISGEKISFPQAQEVREYTDGWVLAVYMQLCSYRETGSFSDEAVLSLMEHLIWDRLTAEQQIMLMRLSVFETFTIKRICDVLGSDKLPDYAECCLSTPFIYYIDEYKHYEPNAVFYELIKIKRNEKNKEFEKECLVLAGDLCKNEGDMEQALVFYAKVKDYKRMLSLDLSGIIYARSPLSAGFSDIALDIAENCLMKVWREHLFSTLCVAWAICLAEKRSEFKELMDKIGVALPDSGQLRAEWLLLSVYIHFPHLDKMLPLVKKAAKMFEGSLSKVVLPEAPWAFYEHLQMTVFHMDVGQADNEAGLLEEFIDIYSELTGGHGCGADALFRAELAYLRCDSAAAEIYVHKAAYLAESKKQKVIQIGVARLLCEIYLLRADAEGWRSAVGTIEQAASLHGYDASMHKAVPDVVYGTLFAQLDDFSRMPEWLKSMESLSEAPDSVAFHAKLVHVLYLAKQGDNAKIIGLLEATSTEGFSAQTMCFYYILKTIGYYSLGEREKACMCLKNSAKIALADNLLSHFVRFSRKFEGLSDELITKNYPHLIDIFNKHKQQYYIGCYVLSGAIAANGVLAGLTKREYEIALLAAEGLRNNEIAEKLFVSENTVRAHLRAIYQKLDIDRRALLAKKLIT